MRENIKTDAMLKMSYQDVLDALREGKLEESRHALDELGMTIETVDDYFHYLYLSIFYADSHKKIQRLEKLMQRGVASCERFRELVKKNHLHIRTDFTTYRDFMFPKYRSICFLTSCNGFGWDPSSVHKGVNGSEEAVIYLANSFSRNCYRVVVYNTVEEDSAFGYSFTNPQYLPIQNVGECVDKFDIVVVWRFYSHLEVANKIVKEDGRIYFWPHDNLTSKEQVEPCIDMFHKYLFLSKYQRAQYAGIYQETDNKDYLMIGNGIQHEPLTVLNKKRLSFIYSSNYGRGLSHALNLWPKIRNRFPEATLDVYYGRQTWCTWPDTLVNDVVLKMHSLRHMGVIEHGQVGHGELDKAFEKASFMLYPCDFYETFCITAVKAQSKGCVVLTTPLAALNETVITDTKMTLNDFYSPKIIETISHYDSLYGTRELFEKLKETSDSIGERWTWDVIASKIISDCTDDHDDYAQGIVNMTES